MADNVLSDRIEQLPEVISRTGLCRSSIYAAISRGDFPQPLKITDRAIGFLSREVDDWIGAKAARRPT